MKGLIKKLLKEAWAQVDDIKKLTSDITSIMAANNLVVVYRMIKGEKITFDNDSVFITEDYFNVERYPQLKNFIESNNYYIWFQSNIGSLGKFDNLERIRIETNINEFNSILRDEIIEFINKNGKEITNRNAFGILKLSIDIAFGQTIMHELRHAYDNFTTKGKYNKNKKTTQYNNKWENIQDISTDQYLEYLNLPHEYWARFTEVVPYCPTGSTFNVFFNEFKKHINNDEKWEIFDEPTKERLTKAAYRYWSMKQPVTPNRIADYKKQKGINEEIVKKKYFGAGFEHVVYDSKINPNVVFKIGYPHTVEKWFKLFKDNPNYFPIVYRVRELKEDEQIYTYVELEKLNTKKVINEWLFLNQSFKKDNLLETNTIASIFEECLYFGKLDFYLNEIKNFDKDVQLIFLKWIHFLKNLIPVIKKYGYDDLDLHMGNFGYDNNGKLKCLDI